MKACATCKNTYPDDANFCPQEGCATDNGPMRLVSVAAPDAMTGRFVPGERVGGTRTGEVFRAKDTQTQADVAYKLIDPTVAPNPAAAQRIERELKQLMRAQNPRIATVIECGKAPGNRFFVAMEWCAGDSLEKTLKIGGPLSLDKAKGIVAQVGQALLEAQKAGVVHRDLAPKNILVAPNGDVKVINFAIAKPINEKASGVAAYLSPEQVQGKPVDQRSNTYNLAAILYHLLTGEPPFQGTPDSVLELHLSSPPLAPGQRRPEANLSPDVDRVILKALDKNSSRRHLTLRLFLQEVEALAGNPTPVAGAKEGAVGYAKTMLFAGGQAEVASMVAKAIAARGGPGAATPAPVAVPPVVTARPAAPTPAPLPTAAPLVAASAPARGAAVAATMVGIAAPIRQAAPAKAAITAPPEPQRKPSLQPVAVRSAADEFSEPSARLTPPPVTPFPPPGGMPGAYPPGGQVAKSPPPDDGKGGKSAAFRETLWFKKGDVEHMIAEAKAKMGVDKPAEPEALAAVDDMKPLEDRYVDDGSVSIDDRKKFSLRTGGTSAAMPTSGARGRAVPGESMTEADMVNEVSSGKKNLIYVAAGVGAIVLVIFVLSMMRGKDVKEVPPAPSPTAAAVPAPPPVVAKPPVVAPAVPVAPAAGGPAAETAASAVKKPGSDKKKSASPHGSRSVDKKKKR